MCDSLIRLRIQFFFSAVVLLCAIGFNPFQPSVCAQVEPAPTTWTSAQGQAIEADFVRLTEDAVVLRLKKNGTEATVPLASLSIDSHFQAIKLGNPDAFSKPVPKAEVKPVAVAVELPKLNLSVDEILKSPFPANPKLEQFLDITKRELAAGDFMVLWHMQPSKMQTDVEEVIAKSIETLGPTTIKQIQILMRDLNTVVQDKKEFLFANPAIASQAALVEQLELEWPLLSGFMAAVSPEDNWQVSNFQKGAIVPWMAKMNVSLAPYILASLQAAKTSTQSTAPVFNISDIQYNILSQTADSAEVEFSVEGYPPLKKRFQKAGDIWIDPALMNDARKTLDAAKTQLAGGAKPQLAMINTTLATLIAAVGGLARANTQSDFDQAVALLQDISRGFAQLAGPPPAGPRPGGPGAGGPRAGGLSGPRSDSSQDGPSR